MKLNKKRLHNRVVNLLDEWGMMEANLTSFACRKRIADEIIEHAEDSMED